MNEQNITPDYYKIGDKSLYDFISELTKDIKGINVFNLANVLKYIIRHEKKNGIEDLKKARWYLDKMIEDFYVFNDDPIV